jgi:hypothetical protein
MREFGVLSVFGGGSGVRSIAAGVGNRHVQHDAAGVWRMRVRSYIYNSGAAPDHVERVLELLDDREEGVERQDVGAAADADDARREAMLTLRESMRIGENPAGIYGEDGTPDFATGVLITENEVGRRAVHVGTDALGALREAEETGP